MSVFGVNSGKVRSVMRNQARNRAEEKARVPGFDLDVFDASSAAEDTKQIDRYKASRSQLEDLLMNGHPMEREEAQAKLNELKRKTTEPKQGLEWQQVIRAGNQMVGMRPVSKVPFQYQKYFNRTSDGQYIMKGPKQLPDADKDIIYKWATWRNFAKDENDMDTFLKDLSRI